jgi:DNA-binding SARP family transcriptional activator
VLIAVHGLIGSRSQVIRQYRRLGGVLARELGESPLPDTEAIYRLAIDRTMRRSIARAALLEADRTPVLRAVGN